MGVLLKATKVFSKKRIAWVGLECIVKERNSLMHFSDVDKSPTDPASPASKQLEASEASLMIRPITLLVVDSHALVRTAISQVLAVRPEIKHIVMARTYVEAEEQSPQLRPDIIWLDMHIVHSPNDGIAEIGRLRRLSPEARIIALSDVEDEEEAFAAIMMGAQGYRSKQDVDQHELLHLIHMIYRGETVLRPNLITRVMQRLRLAAMPSWDLENRYSDHVAAHKDEHAGLHQLTTREREVLELISQGYRDRDIARKLRISEKTVQKHVQGVLSKLGAQNRTEAASFIHRRTAS
jgi:DNA-binding NarL/FixJ family response regulator